MVNFPHGPHIILVSLHEKRAVYQKGVNDCGYPDVSTKNKGWSHSRDSLKKKKKAHENKVGMTQGKVLRVV